MVGWLYGMFYFCVTHITFNFMLGYMVFVNEFQIIISGYVFRFVVTLETHDLWYEAFTPDDIAVTVLALYVGTNIIFMIIRFFCTLNSNCRIRHFMALEAEF